VEAREGFGRILIAQGDYLGAVLIYQEIIELAPKNADAYYNLGFALRKRGRGEEGDRALNQALELYKAQNNLFGVERVNKILKQEEW
jgi:Flp pilus assembly protein TadD